MLKVFPLKWAITSIVRIVNIYCTEPKSLGKGEREERERDNIFVPTTLLSYNYTYLDDLLCHNK